MGTSFRNSRDFRGFKDNKCFTGFRQEFNALGSRFMDFSDFKSEVP